MWKDLSIKQRSALMNAGIKKGIYSLSKIKSIYDSDSNSYPFGGDIDMNSLVKQDTPNTNNVVQPTRVAPIIDWERPMGETNWNESKTSDELGGLSNVADIRNRNAWFNVDDIAYRANKYGDHNVDRNKLMDVYNTTGYRVRQPIYGDIQEEGSAATIHMPDNTYNRITVDPNLNTNNRQLEDVMSHEWSHIVNHTMLPTTNKERDLLQRAYGIPDANRNSIDEYRAQNTAIRNAFYQQNKTAIRQRAIDNYKNSGVMNMSGALDDSLKDASDTDILKAIQENPNVYVNPKNFVTPSGTPNKDMIDPVRESMLKVAMLNHSGDNNNDLPNISAFGGPLYAKGGYMPSAFIKNRISDWEGSSMDTNNSFSNEAAAFNRVLPSNIKNMLPKQALDALYSYSYNVGANNFKNRVVPKLEAFYNGTGSIHDIQKSMYGKLDNKLPGLAKRRAVERQLFSNAFIPNFGNMNTNYNDYQDDINNNSQQYSNPLASLHFTPLKNSMSDLADNMPSFKFPNNLDMYNALSAVMPQAHQMITAQDILNNGNLVNNS